MPSPVSLVPLGGLGEIGMNCMAIVCEETIVVLDCGVIFDGRGLGVDVVHADFAWLRARKSQVKGLILTHGHEDHIGGVPYFLDEFDVPIWALPYARALIEDRVRQMQFLAGYKPKFQEYDRERGGSLGPFRFKPFSVTHSMPESTGLVLDTPQGRIVHTGDFKIDRNAPEGELFDLPSNLGDVRLLMADSTNALSPGRAGAEHEVEAALSELVAQAPERVVVSLFASNVYRLRSVIEIARKNGRKVICAGRALDTHMRVAREMKILGDLGDTVLPRERARTLPKKQCLILATGSQGEENATLAKLAHKTHQDVELGAGDHVILSSRQIPGNERAVLDLINAFERRGVTVIHRQTHPGVHVSGHGHQDELAEMIELVRPEAFLPVHGTFVHLQEHARLARRIGVRNVLVLENGNRIELTDEETAARDYVGAGRIYESEGSELAPQVLSDRALLARLGVVVASVCVRHGGKLANPPQILTRGVVHEDRDRMLLDEVAEFLGEKLQTYTSEKRNVTHDEIQQEARRLLKKYFREETGQKPMIYAFVHEVA